ncbi:unnamed protein product [Phytophthora lilii]|uniref:Unnamed protein product n=1 Tax=Phytophthora lilii TaxID=2077276 RepID=A0A9W6U1W0_9STRA|nr:unnamed protein product [Phytophthora lilii]
MNILTNNLVPQRVYQSWFSLYAHRLYNIKNENNDEDEFEDFMDSFDHEYEEHPVNYILEELQDQVQFFKQRRFFKKHIKEELIAGAMHPIRIQKQLDQFDDIEDFFEAIGC